MSLRQWIAVLILTLAAAPTFGQAAGGGGTGAGGGGGRGNPAQFRQRMEDRLKTELGVTDDEWKALQPKIEAVMDAQRNANSGRGGFGRGGRGRGGGGGAGGQGGGGGGFGGGAADPNATPTPVQQKAQALQTVLDNKDSKADDIKAALTAYREARTAARADLTKAQDDLRQLLTTRQESVLVMASMLE